jgi:hypothetical protein
MVLITWNMHFLPQFNRSPKSLSSIMISGFICNNSVSKPPQGHFSNCHCSEKSPRAQHAGSEPITKPHAGSEPITKPESVANRCHACRVSSATVLPLLRQGINCSPQWLHICPKSQHKNHLRVQASRRGQANLACPMRCRWGEDGGWVPLWYGWRKAVEWGWRLDVFVQLMLTGNDNERRMLCQPVRDLRTRYLTAAAFFEIDPRLKKRRVLGNEQI